MTPWLQIFPITCTLAAPLPPLSIPNPSTEGIILFSPKSTCGGDGGDRDDESDEFLLGPARSYLATWKAESIP